MSNRKKLLLEILLMFFVVVFSNWVVGLGDDEPSGLAKRPFYCIGIALLLSIIGGYAIYRLKLREESKSEKK